MCSEGSKEGIIEERVVVERVEIVVKSGIIEGKTEAGIGNLLKVMMVVVVRAVSVVVLGRGLW